MRKFLADLHIHTCLSPCAELTMSPAAIVGEAARRGIDILGICDHNSAENADAVILAAQAKGVTVLPGMEVTTREEVHLCALFRCSDDALKLQELVYDNLEGKNDETVFGLQVVVNADDEVMGCNERLLIGATRLGLEQVVEAIHQFDGLAIAAHIDREGFGIIGQLGFIPAGLALNALEISPALSFSEARDRFGEYGRYPLLCSSDAHQPDQIGIGTTPLLLEQASFEELRMALKGEGGRRVLN